MTARLLSNMQENSPVELKVGKTARKSDFYSRVKLCI